MHRWLLALIAILLPFPAAAADVAYRYCTIGSGPVTLTRTLRADGSVAAQSSDGPAIVNSRRIDLRGYLMWPAPAAAPVLRLAHGTWAGKNWLYVPADAELGFAGADKVEDRSLATGVVKGDNTLFDVDARKLLDRFRGPREVALHIHEKGKSGTLFRATVDLDALRTTLAVASALSNEEVQPAACSATAASDLTEDRNVALYTSCRADMRDATGGYWAETQRVSWQHRLSPAFWMDANTSGNWLSDVPFDVRMRHPFGPSSPFYMRIVSDDPGPDQTITIIAGDTRRTLRSNYFDFRSWADVMQPDVPIGLELRDGKGKVKGTWTLAANWFLTVEKNLIATFDRVREKQRDPMQYCEPEMSIVIT